MLGGVYLDWNATTPPAPEVVEAMAAAARDGWANPASVHAAGRRARAYVEAARQALGALFDADPRDVVFTSGGTEANNLALTSLARPGGVLITSRIEHPSVTRTAEGLSALGVRVLWVPVEPAGRVSVAAIEAALEEAGESPAVVSLQAVNHETGCLQPVAEVARLARARGALMHCDAVQAVGRVDPDTYRGPDLLTVASHKLRGPKGIGALVGRPGLELRPQLRGGEQERGARPGTQDPVAMAGLSVAARLAAAAPRRYLALAPLRDQLERDLLALAPGALRNGSGPRAPHVTNLSFPGWLGPELAAALDLEGVCVSSGSACSAGTPDPSPVIAAMAGARRAESALRVSLGETTEVGDISAALQAFRRVLART